MYKLIVFDLDFTLWNAGGTWCDHTFPPYTKNNGDVFDANGLHIRLYKEVFEILTTQSHNYELAIASRTGSPETARHLIGLFEIGRFFKYQEIYPASKLNHFAKIHKASGIPYEKMLFFDDEYRNIEDISSLGVTSILVNSGINWPLVKRYLTY